MMDNELINEEILDLWKRFIGRSNGEVYIPMLFNPFKKQKILFVGMNPSKGDKALEVVKKKRKSIYENVTLKDFLWKNKDSVNVKFMQQFGAHVREDYDTYFKPIKRIAENCGFGYLEWECIDLFFYKETKQKDFKKRIEFEEKRKEEKIEFGDFGKKQFKIALEAIDVINPKVIVVVNALASKILKWGVGECGASERISEFDKEIGTYRYTIKNNSTPIPIFFCSMLSCGASSIWTVERLEWQIRRSLSITTRM